MDDLKQIYGSYIACLNARDWNNLGKYVGEDVTHNENCLGLAGYGRMLEKDYQAIPDLRFNPETVICDQEYLASRLRFDCSPKGFFLGLAINGRRVTFYEHAFYQFANSKIIRVRSMIDKAAIEGQL